jgi:succinyl-diaminopimelate desuccinylase
MSWGELDPRDPATLHADPSFDKPFLLKILRSLVETRSVNPGIYEAAMATKVGSWLQNTAARVALVESLPDRPSVAAVLDGSARGPKLVLNGHMDTVPVDDERLWTVGPFKGEVRNGFLYGRGACDMKAGLSVQIAVAHYLSKHIAQLKGSLVLHFAIGEECGEPGTLSLLEAGFKGDVGIVTEPTGLKVATAARGVAFYRIRIRGRSIHASRAHLGVNPIGRLPAVLDVLEVYDRELRLREHPLLGGGTCTPTVLRAGVKENAVPDSCDLCIDRRLLPDQTADGEMKALQERLGQIRDFDPELEFEITSFPYALEPAEIDPESPFARRVLETVESMTGTRTEIIGTPFASDVRNLVNDAGIEAVTFGPGDVSECHCPDERVSLRELRNAALVTAKVAADLLVR